MTRNIKLVQAAASFALTGTGGSCSAVVDLVSVLKGLSIVLRVGVPGLDLIVRGSWPRFRRRAGSGPTPYDAAVCLPRNVYSMLLGEGRCIPQMSDLLKLSWRTSENAVLRKSLTSENAPSEPVWKIVR